MKKQKVKSRRRRWMKARVKAYRNAKFANSFRRHFVNKGILSDSPSNHLTSKIKEDPQ